MKMENLFLFILGNIMAEFKGNLQRIRGSTPHFMRPDV